MAFDWTTGQNLLDYGRAIGADFVGQPFDVYRVGPQSSGDVVAPENLLIKDLPMRRGPKKQLFLETGTSPVLWFDCLCDMSPLLVGDICVEQDPAYGAGHDSVAFPTDQFVGMSVATHPVLNRNVFARLDRYVTLHRQAHLAGPDGYLNQTFDGSLPIRLQGGQFVLGQPGQQAAKIPSGFQMDRKVRPPAIPRLEDQTGGTLWMIYLPALPGFTVKENDTIQALDGSRYRVIHPYFQAVGATGTQALCVREVAQAG